MRRGDNPFVLPVRVVWSPPRPQDTERRSASWWDVLRLGDPRDPDALRQRVIVARWPHRLTVLTGPGASADRLIADYDAAAELVGLTDFTTRRAWLALEKAERSLRGNRYKVPKFVHQEIWSKSAWRDGAVRFGARRGLSEPAALARAHHYLQEMAANHSPFLIDLIANAIHWLYKQGYGAIVYDRNQVAELNALGQEVPLAFLPSHRSNLDRLSLQFLKWENDLPPNHTAGGINMNFFPVGPLIRRTGVFFIRRSFKENELYKFVLRSYLDYLVENRFPLEWYMEGGRSRSGKLLPPRFGLLSYVVDSWRRNKAEDVMLIPISIAYDQIQDLGSYTSEAAGGAKEKESLGWVLSAVRSLRRRYGNIHVRFGEPISVAKAMAGSAGGDGSDLEQDVDLAKLAFEVMYRIGQVTPITPAAVVSIALLQAGGAARTIEDLANSCSALDGFIEEHHLPTTETLHLEDPSEVRRVIDLLTEHGNVVTFDGTRPVYYLKPDQALRAAYYRNVVVHHFVPRGVVELALAMVGPGAVGKIEEELWTAVDQIRDLLKFEFFFPEKDRLRTSIRADLDRSVPGWTRMTAQTILGRLSPPIAPWAIMPFLESYLVVADALARMDEAVGHRAARPEGKTDFNEKQFLSEAMKLGEEYRLMGMVAADSVSSVAFRQTLALARNRGLLDHGPTARLARTAFANEVRRVIDTRQRIGGIR